MSFQISSHGSRAGVIKYVQAQKAKPENSDQAQIEAAKLYTISEINAIPAEFNGVRVEVSGDAHPGGRQIQGSIIPLKLHLD